MSRSCRRSRFLENAVDVEWLDPDPGVTDGRARSLKGRSSAGVRGGAVSRMATCLHRQPLRAALSGSARRELRITTSACSRLSSISRSRTPISRSALPVSLSRTFITAGQAAASAIRCTPLGLDWPCSQNLAVRSLTPVQRMTVFVALRVAPSSAIKASPTCKASSVSSNTDGRSRS